MKKILSAGLMLLMLSSVFGQETTVTNNSLNEEAPPEKVRKFDPSRLVFGGNLGASFGDYTFINISPQVGYMLSPMLTAGAGINYVHTSEKFMYNGYDAKYNYSYAGMNVFGRFFPVRFLMLSVQPEINYSWGKTKFDDPNVPDVKEPTDWVPVMLVGGGVVLPTGGRGGMMVSLQYDVIQDERSPYGRNAFINVGFTF